MDHLKMLEAPVGWFLLSAKHEHTEVKYKGDIHEPLPHKEGPFLVEFQKYPEGGRRTAARGHTLWEAWKKATEKCQEVDLNLIGGGRPVEDN